MACTGKSQADQTTGKEKAPAGEGGGLSGGALRLYFRGAVKEPQAFSNLMWISFSARTHMPLTWE